MKRRDFVFAAVLAVLLASSCAGITPTSILSAAEAGVADAEIAVETIQAAAGAYFVSHPDPALQGRVDAGIADATTALRGVNAALVGATSLEDGNVQAALQAFAGAFSALTALVAQIGVQVSESAPRGDAKYLRMKPRADGIILVAPPVILQTIRAKKG